MVIENFVKHRADGRLVPESLGAPDIARLGWKPSKILRVEWECDGRRITFTDRNGLVSCIVPGRRFVVFNGEPEPIASHPGLFVVAADGSLARELSRTQLLQGQMETGEFRWFEEASVKADDVFGVAFERPDHRMRRLEFNAHTGDRVFDHEMR